MPDGTEPAESVCGTPLEIVVFVLLGVAGWQAADSHVAGAALAIGLPVLAGVLWGLFAAPRALVPSAALRVLTQVLVLGGGVVAGFLVLPTLWALAFAVVVLANSVLMYVGPFARRPLS